MKLALERPGGFEGELKSHVSKPARSSQAALRFGSAMMKAALLSNNAVVLNIAAGQAALGKLQPRLAKPGVRITRKKGVPLFRADPEDPSHVIRELDGRVEKGFFEGGIFRTL